MPRYHFSLGNSSEGPIGFCAAVSANSPEEAVELLKEALPTEHNPHLGTETPGIEYIEVYFNADAVTADDLDEEEDDDPEEDIEGRCAKCGCDLHDGKCPEGCKPLPYCTAACGWRAETETDAERIDDEGKSVPLSACPECGAPLSEVTANA